MKTLSVGDDAPQFSLSDQDGNSIALADFAGEKQVLVYFYPKALTPGCTTQACGLRDYHQELADLDTVVLGMSPDPVAKLKRFEDKHNLNFRLLSDEDHSVADQFGVWGPKKFMGREYDGIHRLTFLIGKDGKIAHVFNKFKTKDHHEVVLNHIKENA